MAPAVTPETPMIESRLDHRARPPREGRGKPHLVRRIAALLIRAIPICGRVCDGIARAIRLTRRGFGDTESASLQSVAPSDPAGILDEPRDLRWVLAVMVWLRLLPDPRHAGIRRGA